MAPAETGHRRLWLLMARGGGSLAVLLAVLALVGWTSGPLTLASWSEGFIPMAPSTAALFLVLGLVTLLPADDAAPAGRATLVSAGVATSLAFLLLAGSLADVRLPLEHLGLSISGTVGGAPLGHMSPLTAATFVLAGGSLLLLSGSVHQPDRAGALALGLGATVALSGAILLTSYLLSVPLLYDTGAIPPAVTTSAAFTLLGVALLARSSLRLWSDATARRPDPRLVLAVPAVGALVIVLPAYLHVQGRGVEHSLGLLIAPVTVLFLTTAAVGAFLWQRSETRYFQRLTRAERRYRRLFEDAPVGIFRTHSDGSVREVNPRMATMMGFATSEEVVDHYRDVSQEFYVDPGRRDAFLAGLRRDGTVRDFSYEARTRSGGRIWLLMDARVADPEDDGSFTIEGFCRDVTAHKRAEDALRRREAMLARTERLAHIGSWEMEVETGAISWSPEMYRIMGYPQDAEVPSLEEHARHFSAEEFQALTESVERALDGVTTYRLALTLRRDDGEDRAVRVEGYPEHGPDGRIARLFGFVVDITEEVRAAEAKEALRLQLAQAQKMESVGRLAGGIAHDFNNMLSVILGNVDLALHGMDEDAPLREELTDIKAAARRSAELTRQLLAFAREQMIEPRTLDLNETVSGMMKMLQRLIGENVTLEWKPAGTLGPVRMDPAQIDQILANLLVNASDAIDGTGTVTIRTADVVFDDDYVDDHVGFVTGEYVMLAVSDTGCGMDHDTLGRVFDPFFTTKAEGAGTGLGLATVHGVVKQNHGFINAYSEVGQGTTFKIYLPRASEEPEAEPEPVAAPPAPALHLGEETVLLVEDQPGVLASTRKSLQRMGYTVLAAASPDEALTLAREHRGPIDLLLTDVIMPGMNGRQLTEGVEEFRPGLPTLYMSGYAADIIADHGVIADGVNLVRKPFSVEDLSRRVREVLDAPTDS